jgi:Amt family ammonium transporter
MLRFFAFILLIGAVISPAQAMETQKFDTGDTAFMIISTALVLMMTLPGLALFYSGMVRKKNILATMAQSLIATALISILWCGGAYSLAFSGDGAFIGDASRIFLKDMGLQSVSSFAPTIPEIVFMAYQMTFAVITCALVAGSVAERMTFSAFIIFSTLWLFIVYVPSAHWVWAAGSYKRWACSIYAGTMVHINAGVAGLVAALMIGNRVGFGRENLAPFDLSLAVIGTGLLWVGWFGFNGGSALGANSRAVFAIVATHLAACAGALIWSVWNGFNAANPPFWALSLAQWRRLGTITPASGYVLPWHGLVIGLIAGAVCYWCCTVAKHLFRYDDTLDVFGYMAWVALWERYWLAFSPHQPLPQPQQILASAAFSKAICISSLFKPLASLSRWCGALSAHSSV